MNKAWFYFAYNYGSDNLFNLITDLNMDALLKPARLDLDRNSPTAAKEWKHWHKTFTNFITECGSKAPDTVSIVLLLTMYHITSMNTLKTVMIMIQHSKY